MNGREYFFGGGVCVGQAGQTVPVPVCQVLELGTTTKTQPEIDQWMRENSPLFTTETYNLLTHNCNHFAHKLALFLTNGQTGLPDSIVNIANEALSTPQGQQIRMLIEGFDNNLRQNSQNLNPFGDVGPGSTAGMAAAAPGGAGMAGSGGAASATSGMATKSPVTLSKAEEALCSSEDVQDAFKELGETHDHPRPAQQLVYSLDF